MEVEIFALGVLLAFFHFGIVLGALLPGFLTDK